MRKHTLQPKPSPRSGYTPRDWRALGLILAVALTTSACGFKLRGLTEIPPELSPIFIEAPQGSLVRDELIRQLRGSQVQLAATPQQAKTLVSIRNERRSSHVTSVDNDGKVLAQKLHYGLTFDAVTADKKQLVPEQSLDLRRSYENPGSATLGKQQEGQMIYEEMFRDAAGRILERLRAGLSQKRNVEDQPQPAAAKGKSGSISECRRARDAKRDIPVPLSPCARATTCTCRGR
ncbi:MAG: hypothetical protein, partial [Olavius algarvensis Gamma 1 endosymbiont]